MKILTVVGARPQFIKAAVVSRALSAMPDVKEILVHTGQHYDDNMSEVFFREMKIPRPDYHLGVGGTTHGAMTGRMMEKLEEIITLEKPDTVLVYGDTNSTLAGALTAVKCHVPVAHVEAGLRSFNMRMPEEINRILTDQVSSWLFCPTETAVDNLAKEGIPGRFRGDTAKEPQVLNVGDVMYDAVLFYKAMAEPSPAILPLLEVLQGGAFYLSTLHRAENTDDPVRLKTIVATLDEIAQETPLILPLHPRTRGILAKEGIKSANCRCIDPLGYMDMLILLSRCAGVFTDSGGLQKEAYFLGKRCIVLRDETEWVELIASGANLLAGADRQKILLMESQLRECPRSFDKPFYGNGDAGRKIIEALISKLEAAGA